MHIGIYINNENISGVNCSDLMLGNPGIGGTEYSILLLAQAYKKYYPEDSVTLFVNRAAKVPSVDSITMVEDLENLCEKASKSEVDFLVISAVYNGMTLPRSFFNTIESKRLKTILWGHNFYLSDFCNQISKCSFVKANVFVGRQQYDRYIDHKVIRKSTYIYNMYPKSNEKGRTCIANHSVTYIGSLVPSKGFHVLAAAWREILERVPDATLNVIGSGRLYGRDFKLGKYNIAEEEYENLFMPGLVDGNGCILPSVNFLGVLGTEKNRIIEKSCVGVVNPTGRTETFGISALDFESKGVPVVTIAKGGFLDTVVDGETGLLYRTTSELIEKVVFLLKDHESNYRYGQNGRVLSLRYAPDKVISQWHDLFLRVYSGKNLELYKPDNFMKNNLKQIRWLNRRIKSFLHIEYPISVIGLETFVKKLLRRMGK